MNYTIAFGVFKLKFVQLDLNIGKAKIEREGADATIRRRQVGFSLDSAVNISVK